MKNIILVFFGIVPLITSCISENFSEKQKISNNGSVISIPGRQQIKKGVMPKGDFKGVVVEPKATGDNNSSCRKHNGGFCDK